MQMTVARRSWRAGYLCVGISASDMFFVFYFYGHGCCSAAAGTVNGVLVAAIGRHTS